jgi:hypothetical protein
MGRREILHTLTLLVEIEGLFTHEFATYDMNASFIESDFLQYVL